MISMFGLVVSSDLVLRTDTGFYLFCIDEISSRQDGHPEVGDVSVVGIGSFYCDTKG